MGKSIIIKGADFSNVAVPRDYIHTSGELLTFKGFYDWVSSGQALAEESRPDGTWRSGILPLEDNMYVEKAVGLYSDRKTEPSLTNHMPAIAFLSSADISDFIVGSEIFPERPTGATGYFGVFSGVLAPPPGATHVIITTNYGQGGSPDDIIAWD